MTDEYIIINKTKWLEVLENNKKPAPHWDGIYVNDAQSARVELLEEVIEKSTPLIPEIEKAFGLGAANNAVGKPLLSDYIENLKLEI